MRNCTIVCGNTLEKHSLIDSSAVVCKDVEPYSSIMVVILEEKYVNSN
jgi:hypothetical protein